MRWITVDQASLGTAEAEASATSIVLTTTQPVAAGGFIVLCAGGYESTVDAASGIASVSGGGLTWTVDKQALSGANARRVGIVSAQAPAGLAASTAITVTYTHSTSHRTVGAMSFRGVAPTGAVDGTPPAATTSAVAAWTSGSVATTTATGVVIVSTSWDEGTITGSTVDSPSFEAWEIIDADEGTGQVTGYRIEGGAGSYTVEGDWNAASQSTTVAVAYRAEVPPGDCRAADIFDRGNEDLLSDGWAAFADWDEMQILSNTVFGAGEPSGSIFTAVTLDDDQWASVQLNTLTGTANDVGIGLMLRASDSAEDCYTCVVNFDGDTSVGKYIAGSYTSLQVFAFPAFGAGDELRFEAEGTALRVYSEGVLVGEVTDSSLTGGYPGICRINTTGNNVEAFFAGNLNSSPSIVGISEVPSLLSTGSATVIVPADAEFAVAMYSHWDPTPDTIDYVRLDGEDFTPRGLRPPTGSDSGAGILTLDTMPAPGPYTLTWGWLAGANQDEGGRIYVVFLKDLHATSPFRDVGTDGNDGINAVTASLATAPGDFVLGMSQKYAGNPAPKAYALIDGVVYNGEHFDVGIAAPSSGVSTSIPSGAANYNTQAFISFPAQSQAEDVLTLPIATGNDDGQGFYTRAGGGWPPSTGGSWSDDSGSSTLGVMKYDKAGVDSGESVGALTHLRFDTSPIPDDAVIESALLRMYVISKNNSNSPDVVGDYYDFGGAPTVAADWIETASPSIFTSVDLGAVTAGVVNDFVLTDLTGINTTGYTGIRLTLSSYSVVYNHDLVSFASYHHTVFQEPRLLVTYSVPTITFLHSESASNFDERASVAITDDIPVGSLVVVHAATFGDAGTEFAITDDWNHEYTLVGSPSEATHGVDQMAYTLTTRPLYTDDRIRVETDSGSTDTTVRYSAYSGCDGTLIDFSQASDQTFPPTPPNSGNVTIPATETLLVGVNINDGGSSFSVPTSGFTTRGDDLSYTSSWRYFMEDRIISGGAGDYASVPGVGDNYYWSSTILAFAAGTPPASDETIVSLPIASSDDDASAYRQDTGLAWPPVGSIVDTVNNLYAAKGDGGPASYTYSNNAFFRWDTSSLPDGAVPVAARVRAYVSDRGGSAAHMLEADYYDFGGGTPTLADYAFTVTSVMVPFPYAQAIPGQMNTFLIDNLSGIDTEGYTGLRFALSDIGAPPSTTNYSVEFNSYAEDTLLVAVLEIAYTLGEEFPLMWFTAIV